MIARMSLPPRLQIRSSLTPHDVSVLILVYFHCFSELVVPPSVFVQIITPSIPSLEVNPILKKSLPSYGFHKPIVPLLRPLIDCLLSVNARETAVNVVSFLQSMDSLDVFTKLLKSLERDCLVKNYRSQGNSKGTSIRKITRTSFIGIYLSRCLTKYQIGDFKDKELLWDCLSQYITDFKQSPPWFNIQSEVGAYTFDFMPQRQSRDDDREMIAFFEKLSKNSYANSASCMLIDHTYFQSMLSWQIYEICQSNSIIDPTMFEILSKLSLNDITRFPAVHIINYLIAVRDDCYQDALDALHNYFDYMLTQNEENCFHISLLCLATFHMCFHDCPAAIKSFEEATKIARENKDSETLNLIMIWVVDFIEIYPEYANKFQVTVDQIVRYLKSCSDKENALVFENAYRFESLLLMMDNSSAVLYLESAMKYIVIALQRLQSGSNVIPAFKYMAQLWDYLGLHSLSSVYKVASKIAVDSVDEDIEKAFNALETGKYTRVSQALIKLDSPRLNNEQSKMLRLLEIRFYITMKDYKMGMARINQRLNEFRACVCDARWQFHFELQRCVVFLSSGLAMRSVPLIKDMINGSEISKNSFHTAQAIILLCQVLQNIGKFKEYNDLLTSNLPNILQFPQLEGKILNLINLTPI